MSLAFLRVLRERFPVCICAPDFGVLSQKTSGNPFLTHDCPAKAGQESATAGGRSMRALGIHHVPFAQDTLYGLRNLHDGGCV